MLDNFNIPESVLIEEYDPEWREYNQPAYCYDPDFEKIEPGTRLNGYFQSELFFEPYACQIRKELQIRSPLSLAYHEVSSRILVTDHPVSIHVRRGDFVTNLDTRKFHGICSSDYYVRAAQIVEGLSRTNLQYFVFSDDRMEAQSMLCKLGRVEIVDTPAHAPWEDLALISKCHHHILANSSFSWWSSWLNRSTQKIIVAPRHWVASETLRKLNTADLFRDGMILI
jgi:hypothetical protein